MENNFGLNAFKKPITDPEIRKNWDTFFDNLKKNKDDISPVVDLANVSK